MVLFKFEREITEEQNKLLQIIVELNQTSIEDWVWTAIKDSLGADLESADSLPLAQKWYPEVQIEEEAKA